jgi:UDP-N-acetyl-D-glucosamine dehydrogenase
MNDINGHIDAKKVVGVIGLGYVGLPLLINFSKYFDVLGFDSNQSKVEDINNGISGIDHISPEDIRNIKPKFTRATSDYSMISNVDAIIICVPTPITIHNDPDLSYVNSVVDQIIPFLKPGQLISLESTTYPGTTDEIINSRVNDAGFTAGKDIFITYSPEREDPGSKFPLEDIPKVIGGITDDCTKVGIEFYTKVFKEVVPVSSVKVAELSKLLENIHRAVNLGMINEFKITCDAMNVDPFEVIKAASTKPFGFVPYYPGPGWGGHCIPVDPFYLSWKAKEFGLYSRFIELAGELNLKTQKWVVSKISECLNRKKLSLSSSKILLLGIAYKANVDDARESPALNIYTELSELGAHVDFSDPYFNELPSTRKFKIKKKAIELNAKNIKEYDLVVVLTDHNLFDFSFIYEHSQHIVDTRGVYSVDDIKVSRA